jgi:hypothetical protein
MKTGFIKKEGHMVKNWKSRYFVLNSTPEETRLAYFVKAKSSAPFGEEEKGFLVMKGCTTQRVGNFVVLTPKEGSPLKLDFEKKDKEEWMLAFRAHITYADSI